MQMVFLIYEASYILGASIPLQYMYAAAAEHVAWQPASKTSDATRILCIVLYCP